MDKFFDEAGRLCEQAQDDLLGFGKGFFAPDKMTALAVALWAPIVALGALVLIVYFAAAQGPEFAKPESHWLDPIAKSTAPYFIAGILTTIWLRSAALAKPFGWTEAIMMLAGIGCLASLLAPIWGHIAAVAIYFALLFVADYHHAHREAHAPAVHDWYAGLATVLDKLLWVPALLLLLTLLSLEVWFPTLDDHRYGSPFWAGFDVPDPTAFGLDRRIFLHLFTGTQCLIVGLLLLLRLGDAPSTRS